MDSGSSSPARPFTRSGSFARCGRRSTWRPVARRSSARAALGERRPRRHLPTQPAATRWTTTTPGRRRTPTRIAACLTHPTVPVLASIAARRSRARGVSGRIVPRGVPDRVRSRVQDRRKRSSRITTCAASTAPARSARSARPPARRSCSKLTPAQIGPRARHRREHERAASASTSDR